jgi:hypothetical protein
VVETIGVSNLCEHIPTAVMWNCLSEIALRALGREFVPMPISATSPISTGSAPALTRAAPLSLTPPPEERPREPAPAPKPVAVGPAIPQPSSSTADSLADVVAALEADAGGAPPPSGRARSATQQRFRQNNPGIGRLAANNARRPQAVAPVEPPPAAAPGRTARRGSTEVNDYEVETDVRADDWKNALAVEDEQLVEWSGTADETQATTDEHGRKR